jgi:hypothetical protein
LKEAYIFNLQILIQLINTIIIKLNIFSPKFELKL